HLQHRKLTFWRGGDAQYARQDAEKMGLQEKLRAKQEARRKHMEAFVERFRYKASKARQAQSRLKAIARRQPIPATVNEHVIPFRFPDPAKPVASPIVASEGGAVGYEPGE